MAPADSLTVAALQASAARDDLLMPTVLIPFKPQSNINRDSAKWSRLTVTVKERSAKTRATGPLICLLTVFTIT